MTGDEYYEHGLIFVRNTRNLPSIKTDVLPNMCDRPWNGMAIDRMGMVFICHCDGWLPFPVGHILDFETFDEVYASEWAQRIQQTIIAGTYDYCDTTHCPVKHKDSMCVNDRSVYDYYIEFGIDDSCNLKCRSCRKDTIFYEDEEFLKERMQWVNRLRQWIDRSPNSRVKLMIGNNGEVFASKVYLKFFENEFNSNVQYNIRTNGTLAKRHISELKLLSNLTRVEVSIDAASKEVYEYVRSPAKWKSLEENINYLIDLRNIYKFDFIANFVIQRANLKDVLPFLKWCQERDILPCYTILQNWSSFPNFNNECVHRPDDLNFVEFINIIKTKEFQQTGTSWLSDYQKYF